MNTKEPMQDLLQDADIEVNEGRSEATILYTIRNFNRRAKTEPKPTTKTFIHSPKFYVKGVPWNIMVEINSNDFGLFFNCNLPKEDKSWSCKCSNIRFRIRPVKSKTPAASMILKIEEEKHINYEICNYGFARIKTVDFLLNPINGYIKDDEIVVEVYVSVREIIGVPLIDIKKDPERNEEANELVQAIVVEDVKKCVSLLEKNKYHNMQDTNGRTPLMWAAYKGNLKIVQLLVEANCKINAADVFGYTPLIRAVQFEHIEIAKYLLERGADVNYWTQGCLKCDNPDIKSLTFTALHYCVQHLKDCDDVAKLLINKGAYLRSILRDSAVRLVKNGARSLVNSSTIMWSIRQKEFGLTKMLLPTEEHINATDANGWSPLMYALHSENLEIIQMLLEKGANPCKRNKTGVSPLAYIILLPPHHLNLKIIKCLIEHGAGCLIHTALYTAVEKQKISFVKVLLENKANPNLISETGDTPLIKSIKLNDDQLVQLLLQQGADANLKDSKGCSPISEAISLNNVEIIQRLLEKGSNTNIFYDNGCTPLMQCIKSGTLKILQLLVEKGADVNMCDKKGTTPLMECLNKEKTTFLKFLMDKGADLSFSDDVKQQIVSLLVETDNIMALVHLMDAGVDFSAFQPLLDTFAEKNFDFATYRNGFGKRKVLQPALNVTLKRVTRNKRN